MKKITISLAVVLFLAVLVVGISMAAASYNNYLPMVQRAPNTPTPTPTQTPTPTPTPNPNPISLPNGGFEQGRVIWHEVSNNNHVLILQNSTIAHSGSWYAQLGGMNGDIESIDQSVLIPADHPWLSFWRSIISTETVCTNDFYKIYIDNTLIDNYGLCDKDNSGWHRKAYDLSAYKGQTVKLTIRVETNSSLTSTMFVDDFEFRVAGLETR